MSNSRDPNEWDPEGSPDFSEFPPHYNTEQNFKNLWPTDWSDEDCRQDFRIELQQEKKNMGNNPGSTKKGDQTEHGNLN